MPHFEGLLSELRGSAFYASLECFKYFWQFPLDKSSEEIFSFQTDKYVYTPTLLIQGATDSVYAFQTGMREAPKGIESVEEWRDRELTS